MQDDDAPVPKLPRGKGFALSWPQLMRIGLTLVTLVAIVALRKPCSDSVGRFVTTFGGDAVDPNPAKPESGGERTAPGAASPAVGTVPAAASANPADPATTPSATPGAGEPEPEYELMSTSMTDDELRAAFERAKRRAEAAKVKAAAEAASPPSPAPGVAPAPVPSSQAPSAGSPAPRPPPKER
jgi:hypothetical protein